MAILILVIIIAVALGIAAAIDKFRSRRMTTVVPRHEVIPAAARLAIDLEDCVISSSKHYYDPPAKHSERFDSLRSNYDPSSKKIEQNIITLKYETEYKGRKTTFRSPMIQMERAAVMMKMILQKTTTIDVYEDEDGRIDDYHFDISFLYK